MSSSVLVALPARSDGGFDEAGVVGRDGGLHAVAAPSLLKMLDRRVLVAGSRRARKRRW
jgi:hypothetical protein